MTISILSYTALPFIPSGLSRPELRNNKILFELYRDKGIDYTDEEGNSLLHLAASMQDPVWVEFLCEMGSDPLQPNLERNTPLHIAAIENNRKIINELATRIVKSSRSLDTTNKYGFTPLHFAAAHNSLIAINTLREYEADINFKNPINDFTPLDSAIQSDVQSSVEVLLQLGANPNLQNRFGCTALHLAVTLGLENIIELLLGNDAKMYPNTVGDTPVHLAAKRGDIAILALFHEKGISLQELNGKGFSPILLAAIEGQEDCCLFLLYRSITVSEQVYGLEILLHIAVLKNLDRLAERVAILPLNINAKNSRGMTALFIAIGNKNLSITRILLQNGADLRRCDLRGTSCFKYAIAYGNAEIVRLCIEHDPSIVYERGSDNETPLAYALQLGLTDLLPLFPADGYSSSYVALKDLAQVSGIEGTIVHPEGTFELEYSYPHRYLKLCATAIPEEFKELKVEFQAASNLHRTSEEILSTFTNGRTTIMNGGWEKHNIVIVLQNNLMIVCNRGQREQGVSSFKTYMIHPTKITKELIDELIRRNNTDINPTEGQDFYYRRLPQRISPTGLIIDAEINPLCSDIELIAPKDQKVGNCCAASVKAAARAAIALSLFAIKQNSFGMPDLYYAKLVSKDVSTKMRRESHKKCMALIDRLPEIQNCILISIIKCLKRDFRKDSSR